MLFSYLNVPISNVVLNFSIEKTGVMIFSKDIDYGREEFQTSKNFGERSRITYII